MPEPEVAPSNQSLLRRLSLRKPPQGPAPSVTSQTPAAPLGERQLDLLLFVAVLALLSIGTIAIFSSTTAESLTHQAREPWRVVERQLVFLGLGAAAMWFGTTIDYRRLQRWIYPLLLISLVLLVVTLGMPERNGAKRWIPLGIMTFQPVELAKLALISYLAYSLARKADQVKNFTIGFVPHLVVCSVMATLLLAQPDLGSAVVLGTTTLGMLFIAGARVSYIALALLTAAPVGYHMIIGTPWRLERMNAFFNPDAYASSGAYQFVQARLAMGSGGFTGTGLGNGHQSLGYMVEAHNDFILAPIGEELGFLGVAGVLLLFGVIVWRGLRAAVGARDVFGSHLAFGITLLFGIQALFNAAVVLGIVPNKGITLPLVSAGGSSLAVTMFFVGLLLNVGRRRPPRSSTVERARARRKRVRVRVVAA